MKILNTLVLFIFFASTLMAQTIDNVDPNYGAQEENLAVTISGANTSWYQGTSTCNIATSTVVFSQGSNTMFPYEVVIAADDVIYIEIDIPAGQSLGMYDIDIAPGQTCETSCDDCFEVVPMLTIGSGSNFQQGETGSISMGFCNGHS